MGVEVDTSRFMMNRKDLSLLLMIPILTILAAVISIIFYRLHQTGSYDENYNRYLAYGIMHIILWGFSAVYSHAIRRIEGIQEVSRKARNYLIVFSVLFALLGSTLMVFGGFIHDR
jgi:hypothetical protein